MNAKRRRASPHIASSRQPAIPPGNGSISRSLDPSFQRSPDTRRRRAQNRRRRRNRHDGHPHHTGLPRPPWPCPVRVERDVQHAVFAVCRPAVLTVQALVSASITSDGALSFLNGGMGPPYRPVKEDWTKRGWIPGSDTTASDRTCGLPLRGVARLPDDNMLPTCCRRVKGPPTRSGSTTCTKGQMHRG